MNNLKSEQPESNQQPSFKRFNFLNVRHHQILELARSTLKLVQNYVAGVADVVVVDVVGDAVVSITNQCFVLQVAATVVCYIHSCCLINVVYEQ